MSIHDGHRERTKGEFLARPDSFPDHKLLELLLFYANPRGDTNPTAHALMDQFGSLSGVLDALPADLKKVSGVGDHAVVLLKAVKEMSGRYLTARTDLEKQVRSLEDAGAALRPYFFGARSERVCLLCMDGKSRLLGIRMVGEGNVNAAEVTTRKVMEAVLSLNATHVILAHNHIDGLAVPSNEDKLTTRRLSQVLREVNVALVDHLVFSDDDMVSMKESGYDCF